MEAQNIVNLLNDSDNESSKFAIRKWYIIYDQNNGQNGRRNENYSTIKFETKVIKPNLCDYSDAYILVTGDIKAEDIAANTNVTRKNIFACLFSVHNTISLSRHEQVCLMRLRFDIKHTCS